MRKAMMTASLLACMLLVFACNGGTATPTSPPTDTQPPTSTEQPTLEAAPTDTLPPLPTFTPTLVPTVAPTTPVGTPVTIRFIQMIDGATGWGIGSIPGDDNHVLLTQDGGSLWDDVSPSEPGLAAKHAVGYFYDRHTGVVTYFPTSVGAPPATFYSWRTTNDGATWTQSTTHSVEFLGSVDYPPYIDFVSANTGWIMLRNGGAGMHRYPIYLMKTTNGGASWTMQINAMGGTYLQSCRKTGMDFADVNTGWVTYDNCPITGARISVTTNGGAAWSEISLPEPSSHPGLFATSFCYSHSPNVLSATTGGVAMSCAVGGDPTNVQEFLYVTTTGGASWIDVPYPGGPLYMLDTVTMFAMGQEQHRSTDGGVNWTPTSTVSWEGQFSFVTSLYAWGAVEAAGSYALVKTVNGTSSWAQLTPMVGP